LNAKSFNKEFSSWVDFDWYCLVLPPNTPEDIINFYTNFIKKYVSDPEVLEEFKKDNIETVSTDPLRAEQTVKIFINNLGRNY
jgi:tripartite-type tricarboxylate transporter receptor subunit TctC